jgi:hypothetical protein
VRLPKFHKQVTDLHLARAGMNLKVYAKTAPATTCSKEKFTEMLDSFTTEGLIEYEQAAAREE